MSCRHIVSSPCNLDFMHLCLFFCRQCITFVWFCKDSARRAQNKTNLFVFYAEPKPVLSKDSARRAQNKTNLFVFYAEPKPVLSKDSESRVQNKKGACTFFCFAETHPILSKDSARRAQNKTNVFYAEPKPNLTHHQILEQGNELTNA